MGDTLIIVYGKENCPRCRVLTNRMQNYGIDHEYHTAANHFELHDGWREDGTTTIMADAVFDGVDLTELPIVNWEGKYMNGTEALGIAMQHKETEIIKYGEQRGWSINYQALDDVKGNEFNCPCRTKQTPCPCPGHETAINQTGSCACGLYTKG